jgi:hypothetical protein
MQQRRICGALSDNGYAGHYYIEASGRLTMINNATKTITKEELRHLAGLYDIDEMAEVLGIHKKRQFYYLIERGKVKPPAIEIGSRNRRYYLREDVEAIRSRGDCAIVGNMA